MYHIFKPNKENWRKSNKIPPYLAKKFANDGQQMRLDLIFGKARTNTRARLRKHSEKNQSNNIQK